MANLVLYKVYPEFSANFELNVVLDKQELAKSAVAYLVGEPSVDPKSIKVDEPIEFQHCGNIFELRRVPADRNAVRNIDMPPPPVHLVVTWVCQVH